MRFKANDDIAVMPKSPTEAVAKMLADDLCGLICRLPGDLWDRVPWELKIATGALVGDEKVMAPLDDS
jgi:hypothetical protein